MYFFIGIIITFALIIILKNYRKADIEKFAGKNDSYRIFYPLALYIYDLGNKHFKWSIKRGTKEKLIMLHEVNYTEYVVKRGGKYVVLFIAVLMLAGFCEISYRQSNVVDGNVIKRPDVNEEEEVYELVVNDGEQDYYISAGISPRQLTKEQAQEYFEAGYEEVKSSILGNNESLEEIVSDLELPTHCQNGYISITWSSDNTEVVDETGKVLNTWMEEEMIPIVLTANFKLGDYEAFYDIYLTVIKVPPTKEQLFQKKLNEEIANANEAGQYEEVCELPETVDNRHVTYLGAGENYALTIFLLGVLALGALIIFPDTDLGKRVYERNREMIFDYSEIVSMLTLLLGAGMTLRRAWEKIVLDYRKSGRKRFAYNEMEIAYNKMEAGFSEIAAYEEFASKCKLYEYTKLVSILTQNIKKGNEGLTQKLSLEMQNALEQRKNMAKKAGEEASTKLLVPMTMMLIIVIVIVMVPVFMSF